MKTKTHEQINAERDERGLPPLNFKLFEKVIKRIETKPETYAQQTWVEDAEIFNDDVLNRSRVGKVRPIPPCGSVHCVAGETIICSESTVELGLLKLSGMHGGYSPLAADLLGLTLSEGRCLFNAAAMGWIEPFHSQFQNATTYKGEARAAISYLKYIVRTGKVVE